MSQTLEEKRKMDLADLLEEFLCEGEAYLVRGTEDGIEVIRADEGNLVQRNHEILYGFLLSLNEQLSFAARLICWVVRFVIFSLILAIEYDWFSNVAPAIDFAKLQSLWVYGLLMLFLYAVNSMISEWRQHQIYANRRGELLQFMQESGIPKYRLLTLIDDDPSLQFAAQMIRKDHAQEPRY